MSEGDNGQSGQSGSPPETPPAASAAGGVPGELQISMEVIGQMLAMIQTIDPRLVQKLPQKELIALAAQAIAQQHALVVDFAANNTEKAGISLWGFQANRQDIIASSQASSFQAQVVAPRNPFACKNTEHALNMLAIVALLTSPPARMVAELLGIKLHFVAMRGKPQGLILPG